MQQFATAPWPTSLKVTSLFAAVLITGVAYGAWRGIPPTGFAHLVGTVVTCVPLVILAGGALFVVTGYEIEGTRLHVRRLLWATKIELQGLSRIWQDPDAIKHSLRVCGNAGLFAFTGLYESRKLGRYRMYATDPKLAVILFLPKRIVIVTPAHPQAFIQSILMIFPGVDAQPPGRDA